MKEDSNEIEKFFNSHLGENEIPFEENDWTAMEEKLNAYDTMGGGSQSMTGKYIAVVSLAILLFMAGWFSREMFITSEVQDQVNVTAPSPSGSQNDLQDGLSSRKETTTSDEEFLAKTEGKEDLNSSQSSKKPDQIQGGERNLSGHSIDSNDQMMKHEVSSDDQNPQFSLSRKKSISDFTDNGFQRENSYVRNGRGALWENIDRIEKIEPSVESILPDMKILIRIPIRYPDESTIQENSRERLPRRWSIGVTVAPDFNGVGAAENYRLAWEVGILGAYSLHPKWRLSTGVLYAKKSYKASGDQYSPPEGYWDNATYGIIPERIDAACGIIDIPLNITYLWNSNSRFRFTTTTGLSNYIILNEDYRYEYGDDAPYNDYNEWSTDENSTAFFGMINVAIGVEWEFRPGLDLAIEPYLKVPVKEIGFGNVPLTGTGVFFTIRKNL